MQSCSAWLREIGYHLALTDHWPCSYAALLASYLVTLSPTHAENALLYLTPAMSS